jgi:hypothetical protein
LHCCTLIKIEQIGAAAEQHVLAIVDNLACTRMPIRRGAPSKIGTALKERHAKPGVSQGTPSGEAS